jgi:predicted CopG family antitoxin
MTSIPVHADVLRRLQARKTGGKTWDEFLLELAEDYDPPEWIEELERRKARGRDVSSATIERLHEELKRRGR